MSQKKDDALKWEVAEAFIKFAKAHSGQRLTTAEIDEGARALMRDGDLHGYCISDFVPTDNPDKKIIPSENATLYRWNGISDYSIM